MVTSVFPWPAYGDNPYVARLGAQLKQLGLRVVRAPFFLVGAALLGRGDWLHLHWPGAHLVHRDRATYGLRLRRFRARLERLRARGVRLSWTAHNLVPHDDPHPDLALQARRALLDVVEHVFVHFRGAAAALAAALGPLPPVTVIPHGHYQDDYPSPPAPAGARRRLGLPAGGRVLLAFGNLRPYKNLGEIVAGFRAAAGRDDRLVVAGRLEGGLPADLPRDPRVHVGTGYLRAAEVPAYFAAADAALLAHRAFFTSGSAVLALSMGCPVLGPPLHHLEDLAGGGRVVPTEPTAAGIAGALTQLNPLRDGERAAIRAWAHDELSWAEAAARIARVFRGA